MKIYHQKVEDFKRGIIIDALQKNGWNRTYAAYDLGLQRTYLLTLIRKLRIPTQPNEEQAQAKCASSTKRTGNRTQSRR